MRSSLEIELAKVDEKIATAEAGLGSFDAAIRVAEEETEAAAECVRQGTTKLEQAQSEKVEITARWDEQMTERHDLQVIFHYRKSGPFTDGHCRHSNVRYEII